MTKPNKYYYVYENNALVDVDGNPVNNSKLLPQTTLGTVLTINVQLLNADNTDFTGLAVGTVVRYIVDNDYNNPGVPVPMGDNGWEATGDADEYKKGLPEEPSIVYFDGVVATEAAGLPGTLVAGQYLWDATNGLTVFITGGTDPGLEDPDYVEVEFANDDATPPFIDSPITDFNLAGSWWDGAAFVNPDVELGQLSFKLDANTAVYYLRIGSGASASAIAEMQFFDSGGSLFEIRKMDFVCKNRITGYTA